MYLVNTAVSDIIMCITAVPITPYTAFKGTWVFGKSFCHLLPLFQVNILSLSHNDLIDREGLVAFYKYTDIIKIRFSINDKLNKYISNSNFRDNIDEIY